jgi:hypothetical protein
LGKFVFFEYEYFLELLAAVHTLVLARKAATARAKNGCSCYASSSKLTYNASAVIVKQRQLKFAAPVPEIMDTPS